METNYPKQLIVKPPLLDFLKHCEVYCSAACCGLGAFEIHKALVLSFEKQENLAMRDGQAQFIEALKQTRNFKLMLKSQKLDAVNGEIPVWFEPLESFESLPDFWMTEADLLILFSRFEEAFAEASKYNGMSKSHCKT